MSNVIKLILSTCFISFGFSAYNVGQTVSDSDQQVTKSTCFAGNGYEDTCNCSGSQQNCNTGGHFTLADWNGALNGGHYNVIFIDLTATW